MFETFLQFCPACLLFVWVAFRTSEEWLREDRVLRRRLAGVALVDGRWVIRQEDGNPVMFLEGYQMPCRPVSRERCFGLGGDGSSRVGGALATSSNPAFGGEGL